MRIVFGMDASHIVPQRVLVIISLRGDVIDVGHQSLH